MITDTSIGVLRFAFSNVIRDSGAPAITSLERISSTLRSYKVWAGIVLAPFLLLVFFSAFVFFAFFLPKRSLFLSDMPFFMLLDYF